MDPITVYYRFLTTPINFLTLSYLRAQSNNNAIILQVLSKLWLVTSHTISKIVIGTQNTNAFNRPAFLSAVLESRLNWQYCKISSNNQQRYRRPFLVRTIFPPTYWTVIIVPRAEPSAMDDPHVAYLTSVFNKNGLSAEKKVSAVVNKSSLAADTLERLTGFFSDRGAVVVQIFDVPDVIGGESSPFPRLRCR